MKDSEAVATVTIALQMIRRLNDSCLNMKRMVRRDIFVPKAGRKSLRHSFLLMALLVMAAGCASEPDKTATPRPEPTFPQERYLTAVGSGDTDAEARRHAVAEMSNIFESRVYAETVARAHAAIDETDRETFGKQLESNIRIVSSVKLKGVRIGKIWKDAATGQYQALAVLDKLQAKRVWDAEIDMLDTALQGALSAEKVAESRFRKLQAFNEIMSLWLQREVIRNRLRVIGFPNLMADVQLDISHVARSIAALRGSMTIFVETTGKHGDVVDSAVRRYLTQNGYNMVDSANDADLVVRGDLVISSVDLNNPRVFFVRATVDARLTDPSTNKQVGEIREDIRKGHISRKEAVRMAAEAIAAITARKIDVYFGIGKQRKLD